MASDKASSPPVDKLDGQTGPAGHLECPYDQLHIYELTGVPPLAGPDPDHGFLGCWEEADSAFLFFDRPAEDRARELAAGLVIRESFQMSYRDWQGRPAEEAFKVGRVLVRPPWVDAQPAPGGVEVLLDPGVVFGAGNHPTTRHCLAAVLALEARSALSGRFVDLGCGTGILSLAALVLGAESALAVDLNPLCVHVSRANAALNGLEGRLEVRTGDALKAAAEPGPILAANLQAELLLELARLGAFEGRKALILSGITRSWAQRVVDAVADQGFSVEAQWTASSTWFTFLFRKESELRPETNKD